MRLKLSTTPSKGYAICGLLTYKDKNSNAMNKVIQLLESTKQKQKEAIKQLPKMVDEYVATVAVEGEQFIKEIDQALLVLSAVVGQSEELVCDHQWYIRFSEKRGSWRLCAKCSKEG